MRGTEALQNTQIKESLDAKASSCGRGRLLSATVGKQGRDKNITCHLSHRRLYSIQ